jgi:hypothetical protein
VLPAVIPAIRLTTDLAKKPATASNTVSSTSWFTFYFLKGKSAVTATRQPALPATAGGNRMVIPLPPTAPAQSHDSFAPRHSHQLATLAGDSPAECTVTGTNEGETGRSAACRT